jgi:ethanolamine utilization protein EutQ (cupin superfamily)
MLPNKSQLQRKLENESQSQSSISLIPELRWKDGTGGIKKIMGCTNDHVDM